MAKQSFISEFWEYAKLRKRYWLLPIVIVMLLFMPSLFLPNQVP